MTASPRRARPHQLSSEELYALLRLRVEVFVVEQRCAYPELDGRDLEPGTEHWWTSDADGPSAYLRVLDEPDGTRRIGRVVTRADARGAGLSTSLLDAVLSEDPRCEYVLDAQTYVAGLYASRGFLTEGEEFLDDGIPHVRMRRAGTP